MTVGIIGAGQIGQAVAKQTLRAGASVVISNSRGPDSLESVINETGPWSARWQRNASGRSRDGRSCSALEQLAGRYFRPAALEWSHCYRRDECGYRSRISCPGSWRKNIE